MKRFPIQHGLTISWEAAERAYLYYCKSCGGSQSLERLAERGGFGLFEYALFWHRWDGSSAYPKAETREVAEALAAGDVRSTTSS